MIGLIVGLVSLLLVPLTAPTSCSDVYIVGIRGSGQSGFGEQVGSVIESLAPAIGVTGRSVSEEALDYPAISVSDSFGLVLFNGAYDRSVAAGVAALDARLRAIGNECPGSEIVLVGYSQGAQVIKERFANAEPRSRVSAVVLLADPTRSRMGTSMIRLGDPSVDADGAFGAIDLPHHVAAVAVDVCAEGDGVCEQGRRNLLAHTEGYADPEPIVERVMAELGDRLIVRGPR